MRQFDLSYSVQNGRLAFTAHNENGERALWDVLSLLQASQGNDGHVDASELQSVLMTLKRKGYTVRSKANKR